jgi:uncharacterized protein
MKELIEYLVEHLVDSPADVHVSEILGEHTVIFELHVADGDMGKVIGKNGKTADSLRTIMAAAAAKQGKRAVLEILETDGMNKSGSYSRNSAGEALV